LAAPLDEREILTRVLECVEQWVGVRQSRIWLRLPDGQQVWLSGRGFTSDRLETSDGRSETISLSLTCMGLGVGTFSAVLPRTGPLAAAEALRVLRVVATMVSGHLQARRHETVKPCDTRRKPKRLEPVALIGGSPEMHRLRAVIRELASRDMPILIRGDPGTGKRLVAYSIHRASAHCAGPLVAVHCTAPGNFAGREQTLHQEAQPRQAGQRGALLFEEVSGTSRI
jgi:hypothetical protein